MKTECPYCHANQSVLDDLVSLPLPCKKCGQTFVPAEANQAVGSEPLFHVGDSNWEGDGDDHPSTGDPSLITSDVDWISDPECVSAGIRRVANSYFSLVVAVIALATVSVVGQLHPKVIQSPFVLMFVIGAGIVFLISLFLWFNGQVQLRKGHPVGTGLHEAISRSLNMSVMAIVARVFARILSLPLLKGVGGILSMAAFDRLLLYFELLCIELGEETLRLRVQSLSKYYRRGLSAFIGFILLYAFVGVPLRVPLLIVYMGFGAFGLSLIIFSIWFGAVLQAVRRAVEIRLNS